MADDKKKPKNIYLTEATIKRLEDIAERKHGGNASAAVSAMIWRGVKQKEIE